MSSSSDRVSLSSSSSERSGGSGSSRANSRYREETRNVGRIPMERVVEVREDPPEKLAESSWPVKAGYEWVAADVRTQQFLFRWSWLLKSWLNCTSIFEKGARRDIMVLERVTAMKCVCMAEKELPRSSFICTCVTSHNYTSGCRLMSSPWECYGCWMLLRTSYIRIAGHTCKRSGCCVWRCICNRLRGRSFTFLLRGREVR